SSFSCCAVSHGFAAPTTAADPNVREWATSDLERRHAFLATVTLPLGTALELGAIARLTSGAPFTPLVGSDINGDGARNDRAFIFVPATAPDTAVGNAMRTLIADAPGAVRRCLVSQLARVAARNSCAGPWQPSFDLQLSWRPAWFGLERRLTLSVLTVNLMGGLDEWLHGAASALDSGSPAPARQSLANPIARILSFRDSLGLSAEQVAALHAIADSLDVLSQSMRRAIQRARAVLTPEQWRKVPEPLKSP